jgi:hypothetical protein
MNQSGERGGVEAGCGEKGRRGGRKERGQEGRERMGDI